MTISPEAKDAGRDWAIPASEFQKVADKLTAPLQKEIERLRGEVEKAWREGYEDRTSFRQLESDDWTNSRAKRVAEGKE